MTRTVLDNGVILTAGLAAAETDSEMTEYIREQLGPSFAGLPGALVENDDPRTLLRADHRVGA
jgi:hypothetical protein